MEETPGDSSEMNQPVCHVHSSPDLGIAVHGELNYDQMYTFL